MKVLNKYIYSFKLGIQNSMEYRFDFFLNILSTALPIIVQYYIWTTIFKNSPSPRVYGYSYNQVITYIILASIISKIVAAGFEKEVSSDIKNGGLSKFIVKPMGYFQYRVSCFLGQKFVQLVIGLFIVFGAIAALKIFSVQEIEYIRIFVFIIALILSILLNFMLFFMLSVIAFWATEVWGIFIGANLAINVLSGGILPLDMLGKNMINVLNFLPFKYIIYYPTNIISGKIPSGEIFQGLAFQSIWIMILGLIAIWLWNTGMKAYISVGG